MSEMREAGLPQMPERAIRGSRDRPEPRKARDRESDREDESLTPARLDLSIRLLEPAK